MKIAILSIIFISSFATIKQDPFVLANAETPVYYSGCYTMNAVRGGHWNVSLYEHEWSLTSSNSWDFFTSEEDAQIFVDTYMGNLHECEPIK